MNNLFTNRTFSEAKADMESLGMQVIKSSLNAKPYAIVGGRSNARWWLIPLHNGRVAAAGFALFQPLLSSARLMKLGVCTLSLLGLSRIWARQKLYITDDSILSRYFPSLENPVYAYFTGTDSPHRKVAVQIMDEQGRLKGFAKITRKPQVASLLMYEAAMLQRVKRLKLKSAHIPSVLFAGQLENASILVTDTLKTNITRSITRFTKMHRVFLQELTEKTTGPAQPAAVVAEHFACRIAELYSQLRPSWCRRLDMAVAALAEQGDLRIPLCLSHGDFTPWNTFLAKGGLYVFDWEYAEESAPPSNDIIHFTLNEPHMRNQTPGAKQAAVLARLEEETWTGIPQQAFSALLIVYLLSQVLRQVERLSVEIRNKGSWDGIDEQRGMLDLLFQNTTGVLP